MLNYIHLQISLICAHLLVCTGYMLHLVDNGSTFCRYTSEEVNVVRYAKIAQALNNKTVRDVALRCRWMNVSSSSSSFLFLFCFVFYILVLESDAFRFS